MEIYKNIPWYENYQISNLWNIKSMDYKGQWIIKVLRAVYNKNWYSIRWLYRNWVRKSFLVHRLVAILFIPNSDDKLQINHKNWIKSDNRVENLEYCTASENMKHSFLELWRKANAPMKWKFGKDNHLSKKVDMYSKEHQFIKTWSWIREISRHFGISAWNFSQCCLWKRKSAAWFVWKYVK